MVKAKLYNQTGEEKGDVTLNSNIFELEGVKESLIHQALITILANRRQVTAHTKDKSEVRGGGKKPWKQKGTGRARHGSSRSPIWIGGGVTFGPTKFRNFTKAINKKMKKRALFGVLTSKAKENTIAVVDKLEMTDSKTKLVINLLSKLNLNKKVVLVIENADHNIFNAVNNLKKVNVLTANSLNVYDLLNADHVLFTQDSLQKVEEVYLNTNKAK